MMDIKKIIREEIKNVLSENYPIGAEQDKSAPWNQKDNNVRTGNKAFDIKYDLIWTDGVEFAFFKDKSGNVYVIYINDIDKSELEPYAERKESFEGYDEDGDPIIEYGDWEITADVIENFVNDNVDNIKIGKGVDDYENSERSLVMLDSELRKQLMGISKYIKDDNQRIGFIKAISKKINENGVADNIINKKTMDTPTGTIFTIDLGVSDE